MSNAKKPYSEASAEYIQNGTNEASERKPSLMKTG